MPNASSEQIERRSAIRKLLGRGPFPTQALLVAELEKQGHVVLIQKCSM